MLRNISKIILVFLLLFAFQKVALLYINPYYVQILALLGINLLMALGLNLINGITGQFSLGHAGFMALGAYGSAYVSTILGPKILSSLNFLPLELSSLSLFLLSLFFGACLATLGGLIVGIPALRLRGDYLAIATLGFGEIIRVIITNLKVVGDAKGLGNIPEYSNLFWIYGFAFLAFLLMRNLLNSSKGMALLAIREDEIAASAMGIDCSRYKIMAFSLGAFLAGLGGGLYAHLMTYLHPNSFTFLKSIEYVAIVVLAGGGSLPGIVISSAILTLLPEALRDFKEWRMILYSLLLIGIMLLRPQGLMGNRRHFRLGRGSIFKRT